MKIGYIVTERGTGYNDEDYFYEGYEIPKTVYSSKEEAEHIALEKNLKFFLDIDNWLVSTFVKYEHIKSFVHISGIEHLHSYDSSAKLSNLPVETKLKLFPLMLLPFEVQEIQIME